MPQHMPYHCKSRIAVYEKGVLRDTYWSLRGSDDHVLTDLDRYDLRFLGNLNDYERAEYGNWLYYDDADVLNLNHSNASKNSLWYVRKGAEKSAKAIELVLTERLIQAERDKQSAERAIERLTSELEQVRGGDLNVLL